MTGSLLLGWLLGALLGARHAVEPDHLAAVSTLVSTSPTPGAAARQGALWGLGHAGALFLAGAPILALRATLPARLEGGLELVVAVVLLLLGARAIWGAREAARIVSQEHNAPSPRARPLAVGLIHGFAGTGALVVLASSSMPALWSGVVFMICFGLGSVAGMALIAGLFAASMRRLTQRPAWRAALAYTSGALSILVGCLWGAPALLEMMGRA